MTKTKIIFLSILIFIIAVTSVLFGAVFRIRKQTVVAVSKDSADVEYCQSLADEIKRSADIKNGKSIFMLNKQSAINNIEKTHYYIKVVEINTKSLVEIEIMVRKRYEMFFVEANGKYYILDEDLKVLRITDHERPHLTELKITKLSINSNTQAGDFVGTQYLRGITYNLFIGLYTQALLERADVPNVITEISTDTGVTLSESYNRLILQTATGVKMDIYKPEENLAEKINICFSVYNSANLTEEQKQKGSIKVYLDENGTQKIGYFN